MSARCQSRRLPMPAFAARRRWPKWRRTLWCHRCPRTRGARAGQYRRRHVSAHRCDGAPTTARGNESRLSTAQGDRRAAQRLDQGGPRIPAVQLQRSQEGECRVETRLHGTEPQAHGLLIGVQQVAMAPSGPLAASRNGMPRPHAGLQSTTASARARKSRAQPQADPCSARSAAQTPSAPAARAVETRRTTPGHSRS